MMITSTRPQTIICNGIAAEELDRQRLGEADDETADDRAPDRTDAAQHHRGNRLGADIVAHEGRDVAVVDGEKRAGHAGEKRRSR